MDEPPWAVDGAILDGELRADGWWTDAALARQVGGLPCRISTTEAAEGHTQRPDLHNWARFSTDLVRLST